MEGTETETPEVPAGCPAAPVAMLRDVARPQRMGERHGRCLKAQEPVQSRRGGWRKDKVHADVGRTAQILLRQQQPGTSRPVTGAAQL